VNSFMAFIVKESAFVKILTRILGDLLTFPQNNALNTEVTQDDITFVARI
jgi:hypothetical protein